MILSPDSPAFLAYVELMRTRARLAAPPLKEFELFAAGAAWALEQSDEVTSYKCIRCFLPYNPQPGESENCPHCGHDGSPLY